MIRATLAALVKAAGLWPGLSWVDSELRDVFMLPASGDDVESRRHAGLNQENRSRAGMRPISARKRTDLEPEYDRSRRGSGPISARRGVPGGSPGREVSAQPSLRGDEDQRSQQHEQPQGERCGLLEDLRVLPGRLDRRGDDGEVLRRDDLAQSAAGQVLTTHDREEAGADPTATAPRLHDIAEGGDGHMRVSPGRVLAKEKEQPKNRSSKRLPQPGRYRTGARHSFVTKVNRCHDDRVLRKTSGSVFK